MVGAACVSVDPHAYFSLSEGEINPLWEGNERCFPARHVLRSFPKKGIKTVREIVSYIRVSTEGQHKSGLGEDAQRRALTEFAAQHELRTAAAYSDTASGAAPSTKRPGLAAAILDARKRKCPVVVARLDRPSRDVHFISGLMAEKVPFVVTAFVLDVDPFMLHIYAAVAQKERALISQRTKDALKGRVLGASLCVNLREKTRRRSSTPTAAGRRRGARADARRVSAGDH